MCGIALLLRRRQADLQEEDADGDAGEMTRLTWWLYHRRHDSSNPSLPPLTRSHHRRMARGTAGGHSPTRTGRPGGTGAGVGGMVGAHAWSRPAHARAGASVGRWVGLSVSALDIHAAAGRHSARPLSCYPNPTPTPTMPTSLEIVCSRPRTPMGTCCSGTGRCLGEPLGPWRTMGPCPGRRKTTLTLCLRSWGPGRTIATLKPWRSMSGASL